MNSIFRNLLPNQYVKGFESNNRDKSPIPNEKRFILFYFCKTFN